MNIPYFKVSGWDGAIRSYFMTNKKYNTDIEARLSKVEEGKGSEEDIVWYNTLKSRVINIGKKHTTLLRFVDITFVVDGLHRGGQDDFDSHAKRLESRIVRMTTRVNDNEKLAHVSDYYEGKILTFDDLKKIFNLPSTVTCDGKDYVMTPFGYVKDEYKNDKDVKRGLVPLAVSSMFTVKVNITELCHIVRERAPGSAAHPELQEMIRLLVEEHVEPELGLDMEWLKNNCFQ